MSKSISQRNVGRRTWYTPTEASRQFGVKVSLIRYRGKKTEEGTPFIVEGVRFVGSSLSGMFKVTPCEDLECAHCGRSLSKNRTRTINKNTACYDCHARAFQEPYDNDARKSFGLSTVSVAQLHANFRFND